MPAARAVWPDSRDASFFFFTKEQRVLRRAVCFHFHFFLNWGPEKETSPALIERTYTSSCLSSFKAKKKTRTCYLTDGDAAALRDRSIHLSLSTRHQISPLHSWRPQNVVVPQKKSFVSLSGVVKVEKLEIISRQFHLCCVIPFILCLYKKKLVPFENISVKEEEIIKEEDIQRDDEMVLWRKKKISISLCISLGYHQRVWEECAHRHGPLQIGSTLHVDAISI